MHVKAIVEWPTATLTLATAGNGLLPSLTRSKSSARIFHDRHASQCVTDSHHEARDGLPSSGQQ